MSRVGTAPRWWSSNDRAMGRRCTPAWWRRRRRSWRSSTPTGPSTPANGRPWSAGSRAGGRGGAGQSGLGAARVCWRVRARYGLPVHGIAPMRVARRDALLALGVTDRRSGYPLELLVRAAQAGWRVVEHDVVYGPRAGGKSKVSGSLRGSFVAGLD